jgi:hypothetical protein
MDTQRLWMLLTDLAGKLGVEVRLEHLNDDDHYRVRGGLCRIGGKRVVIVDKRHSPAGRSRQLGLALISTAELDQVYLVPALRDYLEELRGPEEDIG